MTLPYELAIHVERDNLSCTEPGVDHLPIADRTGRGEVVLVMNAGQLALRLDAVLPEPAPVGTVEGLDQKLRALLRERSRARSAECTLAGVSSVAPLHQSRMIARLPDTRAQLRRDEHPIADDDWR